ncbi:MAG TPA: hypothetical protein VE053_03480 [Allosphingosinicella sp.]|nr:hypothetical protein [Allosphingosinicella sp.]
MIGAVLLALMQPQAAPATLVQLDCELAARGRSGRREVLPAAIRLGVAGRRIDSVLLDGPTPFSSYVPVEGSRKLLHRRDQYRGRFEKATIRLRRTGIDQVDLMLEPKGGAAGTYSGIWTHIFLVGQRPVAIEGTIACRTLAGTLAGNS